ncbi:MAG TPA: glycoside hydrolase family 127 protein [Candidatus Paceibacterota bacterium]|nr:glycoside hydrolase family 127 protein [Verrucomicrobiota bacterium]HRY49047.1 glycoside hydrolase family 127 protein [Candidatus Paceibacterota bacterium]
MNAFIKSFFENHNLIWTRFASFGLLSTASAVSRLADARVSSCSEPDFRDWRRRFFMLGMVLIFGVAIPGIQAGEAIRVTVVPTPDLTGTNAYYVGNRSPLLPSPLIKLPIGAVRPEGWTLRMLRLQADGFHGHLAEISQFLQKKDNAWLSPTGHGQRGWEELPYWLKGFQDCAFLLDDQGKMGEARQWIEGAISSQQPDGWFGPGEGRTGLATDLKGREDLWPNMVMLFCLQSFYDQTGDLRVLRLMERYFQYLSRIPEERFLGGYWPQMRAGDLLFSVYWLYNRTGENSLLALAEKVHRRAARWDRDVIDWHNVNVAQGFREPAIYYQQSGELRHLRATEQVWAKVRSMYGQVPGGMFGGDENCRPGYTGPRQAIETCGLVEEMLSDEILLGITGQAAWADRCENVAFNTYPASMTADLKALRYLTAPNQPQSDHISKSPGIQNGGDMYCMNPHGHRCCQHNAGHGWPYFVQHLWYATPGNGLAAVLYAPCRVSAKVGEGETVTITESTRYPFEETIRLTVTSSPGVRFPLYLRVPGWCDRPEVRINGRRVRTQVEPGTFVKVDREWCQGDEVELILNMEVRLRTWEKNRGTVSVDRGPLTYSLWIGEKYVRHGGTDRWPAWDIFPETPWNYGLELKSGNPARGFKVIHRSWPADDQPFEARQSPIQLRAKGRRIPQWQLDEKGLVREVQASPVISREPLEEITLIPMGAARLRISAFPVIGPGLGALEWTAPVSARVTASHCHENDTVEAVADDIVPRNSGDTDLPRFTWWDHRGTTEWVQWEFPTARRVARTEVYWFDDTGKGQCRLPVSWRVFYRRGSEWVAVSNPDQYGLDKDRFNETRFDAVTTDGLRIVVKLADRYSGGILEWRIAE